MMLTMIGSKICQTEYHNMKTLSNLVKVIKLMQTSWFLVCLKICVVPNIGIKVMRSIRTREISVEGVIVFNVLSGHNNPNESASLCAICVMLSGR